MDKKTLVFIITTLVALSGWGTFFYNMYTSNPKIEGRLLTLMTAEMVILPVFEKPKTTITVYLYLVNRRKNPVHILDYELYFDIGHGYERAIRVYGTDKLPQPTFSSDEYIAKIPNFTKKIIYSKKEPIRYGTPMHGFALFVTDRPHSEVRDKIQRMKIVCVDAFNNTHEITYKKGEELNMYLLEDVAGIEIDKIAK